MSSLTCIITQLPKSDCCRVTGMGSLSCCVRPAFHNFLSYKSYPSGRPPVPKGGGAQGGERRFCTQQIRTHQHTKKATREKQRRICPCYGCSCSDLQYRYGYTVGQKRILVYMHYTTTPLERNVVTLTGRKVTQRQPGGGVGITVIIHYILHHLCIV